MVSVRINGSDSSVGGANSVKLTDLVELIKSSIDPEHMITSIRIDGRDLNDDDWDAPMTRFGTGVIEVDTGAPDDFVNSRLKMAGDLMQTVYMCFRDSRKCFQNGNMQEGNLKMIRAVNDLKAFFAWYSSIIALAPKENQARYSITSNIDSITTICKRICQQQLYQSWWALAETIEKELEPALDKLEDFCRKLVKAN
jgi:hypothetical protein